MKINLPSNTQWLWVKKYIIHAKERKSEIRQSEKELLHSENTIKLKKEAEEYSQKKRATEFLINEVSRITLELRTEFSKEKEESTSNDEIMRRKEDLPSNHLKLNQLSTEFQQCLETIPEDYENKDMVVNELIKDYEKLIKEKEYYEQFIQLQVEERELTKENSFQVL